MISPHLTVAALETRYRSSRDSVARSHWQMIWLLAQGWHSAEVAASTGYTVKWGRPLAQRYHPQGPAGLGDRRRHNPGSVGLLSATQRAARARVLDPPPTDGGLWPGPTVAAWMAATLGRPVQPQRGWEMLCRLDLRPKGPRPRHAKAHPAAQTAVKKSSRL